MAESEVSGAEAAVSPMDPKRAAAMVERVQLMAGHYPSTQALVRAERVLSGDLEEAQARSEVLERYPKR